MTMGSTEKTGRLAAGGAILSAAASSACCWLPLLVLGFGASAAGLSAFFNRYRPLFLVAAAVLLGIGFYLNYFRRERCGPGTACTRPNPRLRRFSRSLLWVSTVIVAVFALFPNYVGALLGGSAATLTATEAQAMSREEITIEGMTCESCAAHVRKALVEIPGVADAEVSYESGRAVVTVDPAAPPTPEALREAVTHAEYKPLAVGGVE